MKTATEITANAIYKVTDHVSGKECYAVPSDSQPGMYYRTCWNSETSNWDCTCKHGQYMAERGQGAHCKHTRAAQVSVVANKNRERDEAERLARMIEAAQQSHTVDEDDDPFLHPEWDEAERKRIEREQYREFEFQCGTYNHPWN